MTVTSVRKRALFGVLGAGAVALLTAAPATLLAGQPAVGKAADLQPEPLAVFFGTTHAHTGADNDHGQDDSRARDVFATAKKSGYDFVVLTEHSGPTGPKDPAGYFADAKAQSALFTERGEFVGLAGYEYSDNGGDGDRDKGHLTAFGSAGFINAVAPGIGFGTFFDYMLTQSESRNSCLGVNHPPAEGHGAAESGPSSAAVRRLVALSETSNQGSYDPDRERAYYEGFVAQLDRGWRVAPTCGLDSHGLYALEQEETDSKKPCRSGVLAPELTRQELLDAIRERRVYSTRDLNLRAKYTANGEWMGGALGQAAQVRFDITVTDPDTDDAGDRVRELQVIGNGGKVLASRSFDSHAVEWTPTVDAGSNTYLFVRVFTGEREAHTAVLAPVWLG
jgi:hypothetical protein